MREAEDKSAQAERIQRFDVAQSMVSHFLMMPPCSITQRLSELGYTEADFPVVKTDWHKILKQPRRLTDRSA